MRKKTRKHVSIASRVLFIIARVIVGVAGLLVILIGGNFCWASISGEAEWGWLLSGLALLAGGFWFGWSALKPHRRNVANMSTDIISKFLEKLF